jgi:hypothetical protein
MVRRTKRRGRGRTKSRKSRSHRKSKTLTRMRKYSRKGGAAPTYPIPTDIKYELWTKMMEDFKDHPRFDEADAMLQDMVYEPEYVSQFSGETFEGREDKEYWQGLDKIQAFFKYSS